MKATRSRSDFARLFLRRAEKEANLLAKLNAIGVTFVAQSGAWLEILAGFWESAIAQKTMGGKRALRGFLLRSFGFLARNEHHR